MTYNTAWIVLFIWLVMYNFAKRPQLGSERWLPRGKAATASAVFTLFLALVYLGVAKLIGVQI